MSLLEVVLFFLFELTFSEGLVQVPLTFRYPLYRHDFMAIEIPTRYQCIELCNALKLCRNLHFQEYNKMCVLNSDDYDRQSFWMMGLQYIPISKKDIPQEVGGACKDHSCAIGEICIENDQTYLCVSHEFTTVKCPLQWGRAYDLCFYTFMESKTWTEAKDFCAGNGSELATMDTEEEYHLIAESIRFTVHYYTFGRVWTAFRHSSGLPNWIPISHVPTDGGSHLCLGLNYNTTKQGVHLGPWESVSCDEKNAFVCQQRNADHWT